MQVGGKVSRPGAGSDARIVGCGAELDYVRTSLASSQSSGSGNEAWGVRRLCRPCAQMMPPPEAREAASVGVGGACRPEQSLGMGVSRAANGENEVARDGGDGTGRVQVDRAGHRSRLSWGITVWVGGS